MKNTLLTLTTLCLLASCHNNGKEEKQTPTVSITSRDNSINKDNAYNDLFLDSTAMEKFIVQEKLNDTIANHMRSFYNARNYQFAWFASNGLTEQTLAFNSLYDYSSDSTTDKPLDNRLDALMSEDSLTISATNSSSIKTELQMTWRFINYINKTYSGAEARKLALEHFIPAKKMDVLKAADAALNDRKEYPGTTNQSYTALKAPLQQYVTIEQKGGWPILPTSGSYKKGSNTPAIALLKKRLQATGELKNQDTTTTFTGELDSAIRTFKVNHGHKPDGIITPTILKEMNVPAIARIQQLLLNMERMRWVPMQDDRRLIIVNIPEFMLHVWEGKTQAFDMAVVVGKEGHSTTMFSGKLNQVVFSPYWNVPPSIVRKEILPSIQKNKQYLANNQMEITGQENGLPVVRQLPGTKNSLGKVKFLFPNSFNIYFHDTPAKDLFNRDVRAYSHGCIRLSDPVKMANYVLKNTAGWTPEKIDSAMNSGKEKYVRVKNPVPVLITYYTAWVDENKILHFVQDIYDHDAILGSKLFTDARQLAGL